MSSQPEQQESRAPVKFNPMSGFEFEDLDGMFRAAQCYLQSGFAPKAFTTPQQLIICWARGAELGLRPLQAIDGLTVINNRIGIMGDLALAMVRQSGELAHYEKAWDGQGEDLSCTVTLQRKGAELHDYTFSVREAKQAGIWSRNPVWPQYPKRMTYYRALGFGLRDEFSDILKGLYTSEELQDLAASQGAPVEQQMAPLKFVDADAEKQTLEDAKEQALHRANIESGITQQAAATAAQQQTPLEAQLRREFPAEAAVRADQQAEAAKKNFAQSPAGSTSTGTVSPSHSNDQSPLPDDIIDMSPPTDQQQAAPEKPWWWEHEIKGIGSFKGRTLGTLTPNEMQLIASKWVPAAHQQIARATQEQLDDLKAIEERMEYDKTAKPWQGV
jgi:hypothetical protein